MESHPARIEIEKLLRDCHIKRVKRSGPGGQRRNKVETGVVIEHEPTGIKAESSSSRSAEENRKLAIHKLRIELAIAIRSEGGDWPSELWCGRVHDRKLRVNPSHDDFPSLLLEAVDTVVAAEGQIAEAADQLGVTTSQLIRFFSQDSNAWQTANAIREQNNLPALKR